METILLNILIMMQLTVLKLVFLMILLSINMYSMEHLLGAQEWMINIMMLQMIMFRMKYLLIIMQGWLGH